MVVIPLALGTRVRPGRAEPRTATARVPRRARAVAVVLAGALLVATVAVAASSGAALDAERATLLERRGPVAATLDESRATLDDAVAGLSAVDTRITELQTALESREGFFRP